MGCGIGIIIRADRSLSHSILRGSFADFIGGNILASGLIDGHADRIDVVNIIEEFQCAKGVALHLRIVLSGYEDSKTMFVVNYVHSSIADENSIRGPEALFYPTGEVHSPTGESLKIRLPQMHHRFRGNWTTTRILCCQ